MSLKKKTVFCRYKWESWVWAPWRVSPLYPLEDSYSEKCHSHEQHTPLNLKSVVSAGYYMSLANHTFHATLVTLTRTLPTFWVPPPSNHTIVRVHVYACMYLYVALQKDYVYLHCDLYTPPNSVCCFWVLVDKTVGFFSVERFQIKSQLSTSPLLVAPIHIMPPFRDSEPVLQKLTIQSVKGAFVLLSNSLLPFWQNSVHLEFQPSYFTWVLCSFCLVLSSVIFPSCLSSPQSLFHHQFSSWIIFRSEVIHHPVFWGHSFGTFSFSLSRVYLWSNRES